MNPLSRTLPIVATALNREIVAIEPLSKYLNAGCGALPLIRRSICLAAYRAPWMATCATPGRWSREIMSPTTNTSGCPGSVRSGLTEIRPDRSSAAPVCSDSVRPRPLAWTPAAHTLVTASMRRRVPSRSCTSRPPRGGGGGPARSPPLGPPLVDRDPHGAELHLDTQLLEPLLAPRAELR